MLLAAETSDVDVETERRQGEGDKLTKKKKEPNEVKQGKKDALRGFLSPLTGVKK